MGRAVQYDRQRLAETLRRQYFVIGRDQALACGLTRAALEHRIRAGGPWQRLLPGVYLAVTGTASREQREMAALLHAGPRSEIRFAMPARAVADAARTLAVLRDVRALVAQAVQQQRCSIEMLELELAQGPNNGAARLRAALSEVRDGIRSVAEADLKVLLRRGRLPVPVFNARLYDGATLIAIVDAWWPDAGVGAEVDSREYHYPAEDWQRTMRRHDQLVARGVLLLHFTPGQIRAQPDEIIAQIRAALTSGRERPPLLIRARPAA
jgi:very-short-patch-repair endonuclease